MASRSAQDRAGGPAQGETPEQALKRMGFSATEPVRYFPDVVSVAVPGLGQFLNRGLASFQIAKTFLFAWFIWMSITRARAGEPVAILIAALLFIGSAADFLWTRRSYNRRLAAAKEQLGYDSPSVGSRKPAQLPPSS